MTKKKEMTPKQLNAAQKKLHMSWDEIADEFGVTTRFLQYRRRGQFPISGLLRYAIIGMLATRGLFIKK